VVASMIVRAIRPLMRLWVLMFVLRDVSFRAGLRACGLTKRTEV
jgi:hypothetical protein